MEIINSEIEQYIQDHTSPHSALLNKIERETHLQENMPQMLSGHVQGRLLAMISKMVQPEYILEIGTYTGYSAICLAEGLKPGGKLHTIDKNEELKEKVENYFNEAGLSEKISLHIGNALDIIPSLDHPFDIVFIDADKIRYKQYYDLIIEKIKSGTIILADNVLWSGKVIKKHDQKIDKDTQALMDFNQDIQHDDRVENILLSIRDGLMMIRKK